MATAQQRRVMAERSREARGAADGAAAARSARDTAAAAAARGVCVLHVRALTAATAKRVRAHATTRCAAALTRRLGAAQDPDASALLRALLHAEAADGAEEAHPVVQCRTQ